MLDLTLPWDSLETPVFAQVYYEHTRSGVCYCGGDMENHPIWDNHAPTEMMYSL